MAIKTNNRPPKNGLPQIEGLGIPADPPLFDLPNAVYEGHLMRLAESHGVAREDFLKKYRRSELDPQWLNPSAMN
jgi:hypothetical protein